MKTSICFGCMEKIDNEGVCPKCGFDPAKYVPELHRLAPGTLLRERYAVGKVLGEGGFGITYIGKDTILNRKVAVKEFYMSGYVNRNVTVSTTVTPNSGSYGETFERNREKFLDEARVLARFDDEDGIVEIRDYFRENNTAYIVMNYLDGETLRSYIDREKRIPADRAFEILRPVMRSLSNVHDHNIIHRDISPDNIMLTVNGKVKLLDFGAAREVSTSDIKSLSVILKPGYAPEEQYRSKGVQGPWTDIYAICATLYRCITGTVPEESMNRLFEDRLPSPEELGCDCSKAMSNVIMKGLSVRYTDRYQSVAELLAAVENARISSVEPEPVPEAEPDENKTVFVGEESTVFAAPDVTIESKATVFADTEAIEEPEATVFVGAPEVTEEPEATLFAETEATEYKDRTVFADAPKAPSGRELPLKAADGEPSIEETKLPPLPQDNSNGTMKETKKVAIGATLTVAAIIAFICIYSIVSSRSKKYNEAIEYMNNENYSEAISVFESLDGYKDSDDKISDCKTAIVGKYNDALSLMDSGEYANAITIFETLDGYKDSVEKINECETAIIAMDIDGKYNDALSLMDSGKYTEAALLFGKLGDYKDASETSMSLWAEIADCGIISAGVWQTVGLKKDGSVVAVGSNYYGQCDVDEWIDIVAISAGRDHTVGLKKDGSVVAVGSNYYGQCDVGEWTDIIAVSASGHHTVGLKKDGTVVSVGYNAHGQCDVGEWTDIVAISAGPEHTVGLKKDGTVITVGFGDYGQRIMGEWTDIVAISAGLDHTIGLKKGGTVVAVGSDSRGQCDVSEWTDIVAISAGGFHTVGLKKDGTVVAVGDNGDGQCNVGEWRTDIVAIDAGNYHTVGLRKDGTVVAVGYNSYGQCNVGNWTDIKIPQ